jgi:hypothetical protein
VPSVTWLVHVPAGMLRLWLDRLVPETVRMHQGSETAEALGRLRAEDERVAGDDAEAALGPLTWDQGLQAITQHGLQTSLWYELPRKWLTDLEGKLHIAASLGRLLELVGLRRYAAICRGPETTAVLQAYERSNWEGFRSFRRRRSAPEWSRRTCPGRRCGSPGGRRWASKRPAPFSRWRRRWSLPSPAGSCALAPGPALGPAGGRPPAPGNSPARAGWAQLAGAGGGRAARWVGAQPRRGPSGAGRAGASAFGWQAAAAAAGPARRGGDVGPAALAAGTCGQGSGNRADPGGQPQPSTVIEAVRRFDWHPLPEPPRGEDDVFELWVLRDLASDPEALWYAVAHRLGSGHDLAATVTELALLVLVEAGEVAEATLVQRVGAGVVGEGWHERASGRSPDAQTVRAQLAALLRLLEVLGLRCAGGDWRTRWIALTEPGRALALEALRARATGPRPDPRGP